MLDILQSAIIAIVIALLIFGIHLMTMRTKQENDVFYRMQSEANSVAAIIQEEIKTLYDFATDPDTTFTDDITFINTQNEIVTISFDNEDRYLIIEYKDHDDNIISERSYKLNLDGDEFNFSFYDIDRDLTKNIGDIIYLVINLGIRSRDEDFYQDMVQQFKVVLQKELVLRNKQLQNMKEY